MCAPRAPEAAYPKWLVAYAPRETRTPTGETPHKALNLARLPIPPQARVRSPIIGTPLGSATALDVVRPPVYFVRTHVRPNDNRAAEGRCHVVDLKLTKRQQEIFEFIK